MSRVRGEGGGDKEEALQKESSKEHANVDSKELSLEGNRTQAIF